MVDNLRVEVQPKASALCGMYDIIHEMKDRYLAMFLFSRIKACPDGSELGVV
jgi:hypothetical protein